MAIQNLEDLNALQLDVLTEIGNIGSGNAATALASLLNTIVDIELPTITLLDFEQVVDYIGDRNTEALGISLFLTEDMDGMIIQVLQHEFASKLVNTFYEKQISSLNDISEMDLSVVSEMGNITSAAYVNALASLTGMFINISPPTLHKDTIENILKIPSLSMSDLGRQVLFIDEKLKIGSTEIKSSLILILEIKSLKILFDQLGIAY
jgi:chemotaxis protein CheC